jgi:hypothetical protein
MCSPLSDDPAASKSKRKKSGMKAADVTTTGLNDQVILNVNTSDDDQPMLKKKRMVKPLQCTG